MNKQILITDSLFINNENIHQLEQQNFTIERLDKPDASEQELCKAIKGKHGYILGGIEHITAPVIAASDVLEVISFTGSGYTEFIPAHEEATRKGIAISAATGGNALAVAEYTLADILGMIRNFPLLRTKGGTGFFIARSFQNITLGIIGFGHVGREVAKLAQKINMRVLVYTRSHQAEMTNGIEYVSLDTLLATSDVITLHVSKKNGTHLIGASELSKMKDGTVLINAAFPEAVDVDALYNELVAKRLRASFDGPIGKDFSDIPVGYFSQSNAQTAFNTHESNQAISDRTTRTMINLLTKRDDEDLVNPEFRNYRIN